MYARRGIKPKINIGPPPSDFSGNPVCKIFERRCYRMSDYMFLDETFEESLLIEDDIKESENLCDGCAIIMGDDPCTVCPYQTAEVAAAIERRQNQ
jgi:hypothetical protein